MRWDFGLGQWTRLEKAGSRQIGAEDQCRPFSSPERAEYLSGEPASDDRFIGAFAHELEHTGGYAPEDARGVARKLLPDILSYDPRRPATFPHNGRTLIDDVVDPFLSILTNGKVTGDKVDGPHGDLLDQFPYVGPPHE